MSRRDSDRRVQQAAGSSASSFDKPQTQRSLPSSSSLASSSSSPASSSPSSSNGDNYSVDHSRQPLLTSRTPPPSSSSDMSLQPFTSASADALDAVLGCADAVLMQAIHLLSTGAIGDSAFSFESSLIPGSSTGKHLRHAHDHFRVLLDALEAKLSRPASPADHLSVDYDKRTRMLKMETCVSSALAEFRATRERLRSIFEELTKGAAEEERQALLDERVELEATTPAAVSLCSTVGREIWFVALHAIHHLALCRPILTHELGLGDKVASDFGVAPSTLVFRQFGREASEQDSSRRSKL